MTDSTEVLRKLAVRGETLATAESLTGGLLAAAIVDVAGASAVFRGGLVAYATEVKASLLGVPSDLLAARGPVDRDVALAMAEGVRGRFGADWGVATTGVAGPEPQDGAPVGMVHVAVAGPGGQQVQSLRLDGDRTQVRQAAVSGCLVLLAARLDAQPEPGAEPAT